MVTEFVVPKMEAPHRVLFLGSATQGWYAASDEERSDIILPRLVEVCSSWKEMGARLITSLDDDLFTVGESKSTPYSWYFVYEVDNLETVTAMIQTFRISKEGARLDKWFRLEARICRPFFPIEP